LLNIFVETVIPFSGLLNECSKEQNLHYLREKSFNGGLGRTAELWFISFLYIQDVVTACSFTF